eukprot:4564129-Amphidinium_carterae.1
MALFIYKSPLGSTCNGYTTAAVEPSAVLQACGSGNLYELCGKSLKNAKAERVVPSYKSTNLHCNDLQGQTKAVPSSEQAHLALSQAQSISIWGG